MRILITGGAGFVGSNLARAFRSAPEKHSVVVLDNLKRRGSEINIPILRKWGIDFLHGDIRVKSDLEDLPGSFDLLIEASAEPSVLSGLNQSPSYVLDTNLTGTLNCLEYARKHCGMMIFLSTSRVYSMEPLRNIPLTEGKTRFNISPGISVRGLSPRGISEGFPTHLPRSFYGATKLSSEMIIQEYVYTYKFPALINRCSIICGPGQFGKPDQGVFSLWMIHHYFNKPLKYTGYGGTGKQVRDLLHPEDLYALITKQIPHIQNHSGGYFNVGGGVELSTSLKELTALCRDVFGKEVQITNNPDTNIMDVPLYITDYSKVEETFGWKPSHTVRSITESVKKWISTEEEQLKQLFF